MNAKGPLDWARLRSDIAAAQRSSTEGDGDAVLQEVRTRLFTLPTNDRAPTRSKQRRLGWVLSFAASLALGLAVWSFSHSYRPISFDTGTDRSAGHVGVSIAAQSSVTLPVRFSDGTTMTMGSASRARVTDTNPQGATVVLEDGSISAAVVHRPASRWRVTAGPFTVLVTGTRFDVRWSFAEQAFELDLHEGSVTVLGPSLQAGVGRQMSAGERLRVSMGSSPAGEKNNDAEATAPAVAEGSPAPSPAPSRREKVSAPAARVSSWRQLALTGRYADALSAAEADDFDAICGRESSVDLLLLADTAHFAGSGARAEQAFRSVRNRFAGSHPAAVAAFSLGRMAYDERHDFRDSAAWFQTYLREEPRGTLAREASGRLMEAYRAAGNLAAARQAAEAYLTAYPAGPHAALARSIGNR
jgi:ferric-dicitrate binding protein FerR (iron transport regulator)